MHTIVLATKTGMSQLYDHNGRLWPVTVLRVGPCRVSLFRTSERDGYPAIQMQLIRGEKVLASRESRVAQLEGYEIGQALSAPFLAADQYVDVIGITKGNGFSGVIKRHNFHGLGASHGVKKVHRSGGSVGQNSDPGKVQRGRKMAGQCGAVRATVRNLKVISYSPETGILAIAGSVPGPPGAVVTVRVPVEA